jgi:hypothetical protein
MTFTKRRPGRRAHDERIPAEYTKLSPGHKREVPTWQERERQRAEDIEWYKRRGEMMRSGNR